MATTLHQSCWFKREKKPLQRKNINGAVAFNTRPIVDIFPRLGEGASRTGKGGGELVIRDLHLTLVKELV
jgi:hypothetical protein